ncbi:MAG: hypothetical protein AAF958_03020 [Planctomycetota bacterium]
MRFFVCIGLLTFQGFATPSTLRAAEDSTSRAAADAAKANRPRIVCVQRVRRDGQEAGSVRLIFDGAKTYEIQDDGLRWITVYANDVVTLLDRQAQVRCEIQFAELMDLRDRTIQAGRSSPNPQTLGLDRQPTFQNGRYQLRFGDENRSVQYNVLAEKHPEPGLAEAYRRFADTALCLSLAQRQTPIPPFARFAIGQAIAKDGKTPKQVEITINASSKPSHWTTQSDFVPFDKATEKDIKTFAGMQKLYRLVSYEQFTAGGR